MARLNTGGKPKPIVSKGKEVIDQGKLTHGSQRRERRERPLECFVGRQFYGYTDPFLMSTGVRCSGIPCKLICTQPSL